MFDSIKNEIYTRLAPLTPTSSGFHRRNCPLCVRRGETPDRRQRFGINVVDKTIIANCFNCKFKMRWTFPSPLNPKVEELLEGLGFTVEEVGKIKLAVLAAGHGLEYSSGIELYESLPTTKWHNRELPTGAITLENALSIYPDDKNVLDVANYLLNRKIYDLDKFYWADLLGMKRRFILPFRYNKRIVGYTTRTVDKNTTAKYLNAMPEHFVFNLDAQQSYQKKYLIITEGVLDAWQTTGVGTVGAISNRQADIIDSLDKECVVVPDRNRAGNSLVEMALKRNWAVSFPVWEDHIIDPAQAVQEYGKLYTIDSILSGIEKNPVAIKIKRRMDL